MAAELGRRGGKKSKRKPAALRRILMALSDEIDSKTNCDIFSYWQTHDISAMADNSPKKSCWFKHSLRANPLSSNDPGKAYHEDSLHAYRALPEAWDDLPDCAYVYWYFDGKQDQATTAHIILLWQLNLHR